ncbi:AMP-binding protein [Streptomyces albidoflavus]
MTESIIDGPDVVAQMLADKLKEMAEQCPSAPALVAIDEFDKEEILTWHNLRKAVTGQSAALLTLRRNYSNPVVHLQAGADLRSAVVILSCLHSKIPVLVMSTQGGPDFIDPIVETVRENFGDPIDIVELTSANQGSGGESRSVNQPSASLVNSGRQPIFLLTSSGSTGEVKVIPHYRLFGASASLPNALFAGSSWRQGQRQLVIASLYHLLHFSTLAEGALGGCTTVLVKRFSPKQTLSIIGAHEIEWFMTTPMHMREMLEVGGDIASSVRAVRGLLHGAGPCPIHVKRGWIELLSPGHVYEFYAATEGIGATFVNGHEWLERPGTVGRGFYTQVTVRSRDGSLCPPGQVGRVYFRRQARDDLKRDWLNNVPGGHQSLGDLGWLDRDNYLFLAGREQDQLVVSGQDVTPAQVDALLHKYPGVRDCLTFIVEGAGSAVSLHALVVPHAGASLTDHDLQQYCAAELKPAEVPCSFTLTHRIPRSEIGKIRRRVSQSEYDVITAPSDSTAPRPYSP